MVRRRPVEHPNRIPAASIKALCGGEWPEAEGFGGWHRVVYFECLAPGLLQGFDDFNEPFGPSFEFAIRARTNIEELAAMRRNN